MKDKRDKLWIGLALLVGTSLILFRGQIPKLLEWYSAFQDNRPVLAKIHSLNGSALLTSPNQDKTLDANEGSALHSQDLLDLDATGPAILSFNDGFLIEFSPESRLVIEKIDERIEITLLHGSYRTKRAGVPGKIIITKNGIDRDATLPEETMTLKSPNEEITTTTIKNVSPIDLGTTLPDDYISSVIQSQRGLFNRCYVEHLKINPEGQGTLFFSFTIEPEGNVSGIRFLKGSVPDLKLRKCASTVIERSRFRRFQGDPIVVNYPIHLE